MKKKAKTRESIIKSLKNQNISEKTRKEGHLAQEFLKLQILDQADNIGLFISLPFEFDTSYLIEELKKRGKNIYLPRVIGKGHMEFYPYEEGKLERSKFGVMEPLETIALVPDLLLVPGLAFNEDGYRIGFGGGFYDRYLAKYNPRTVSLAFDFQKVAFDPEPFDKKVDLVYFSEK